MFGRESQWQQIGNNMATGEYKLIKENSGGTFDEKTVQAESGKVLGFDVNLDPVMADAGAVGASSYTLDFQASVVVMNDINLEGAITITDIIGLNVDTLKLDNVAQALGSGLSIAVSNQQILAWEITRTAPGYAALGIKFTKS